MNKCIRDWIGFRIEEKGMTTVAEIQKTFSSADFAEIQEAIWYNIEQGKIIYDDVYQSLLPNNELKDK